jgi:hypothetical protein
MKHNEFSRDKIQNPAGAPRPTTAAESKQSEIDLAPSPDEVARRTYLSYVNQGSQPGHEVHHWLAAEAELIAERNITRAHGFHNRT